VFLACRGVVQKSPSFTALTGGNTAVWRRHDGAYRGTAPIVLARNELLLKLGLRVSPRTVRKYMPKRMDHGRGPRLTSRDGGTP
jgi:hypothetical protein